MTEGKTSAPEDLTPTFGWKCLRMSHANIGFPSVN